MARRKFKSGETCNRGMIVQTILFDKKVFTPTEAEAWLYDHGFEAPKIDSKGKRFHRARQAPPKVCKFFRFGKAFKKGVRPVYCCPE